MRLMVTWKDVTATLLATLLTGAILGVYAAFLNGTSLRLISHARGATAAVLVLLALGMGPWVVRALHPGTRSRTARDFAAVATTIGNVALLVAVIGLITGNAFALALLVVVVVALWLIVMVWCASSIRTPRVSGRDVPKATHPQEKVPSLVHRGEGSKGHHRSAVVEVGPGAASPTPTGPRRRSGQPRDRPRIFCGGRSCSF